MSRRREEAAYPGRRSQHRRRWPKKRPGGGGRRSRLGLSGLYLNSRDAKLYGVCAGLADYLGIGVVPLRIAAIAGLFVALPTTVIVYLAASFLLPERPADLYETEAEEHFWQEVRRTPGGTVRDLRHKMLEVETRLRRVERHATSSAFELGRRIRDLE